MNDSKISKKYVIFIIFSIIFLVTPYPLLSIAILLSGILYYLDKICDYLKKDGKISGKRNKVLTYVDRMCSIKGKEKA